MSQSQVKSYRNHQKGTYSKRTSRIMALLLAYGSRDDFTKQRRGLLLIQGRLLPIALTI
jgi:hypothetical protein